MHRSTPAAVQTTLAGIRCAGSFLRSCCSSSAPSRLAGVTYATRRCAPVGVVLHQGNRLLHP